MRWRAPGRPPRCAAACVHKVDMALEIELKFRVPETARKALLSQLREGSPRQRSLTLAARYFDTADRRLAQAGLAWRLRREGRRWVQALKAPGDGSLQRFEHELVVADGPPDAQLHAGTAPGQRLLQLLAEAQAAGQPLQERFCVEVRRRLHLVRTRGALVELAFDEGWIVAGAERLRVCELEFELKSGPVAAMLALAERWRDRHGLWLDPRTKSERGDALADGQRLPRPRRSEPLRCTAQTGMNSVFAAAVDECLAQIGRNAIDLCDGDPAQRAEHVHQLRVGLRRLRSALRCFRGWVEPAPDAAVAGLRGLFADLGRVRDDDVQGAGIASTLAAALVASGAPAAAVPPTGAVGGGAGGGAPSLLRGAPAQQVLFELLRWRAGWSAVDEPPLPWADRAARRLARWHRGLQADAAHFDQLDEGALHDLRKRVKRQRYALEFLGALLKRRKLRVYLDALTRLQDRLGELNDLFVARDRQQARAQAQADPAAWFALGWLAARLVHSREAVKPALQRLARCDPPRVSGRALRRDRQLGA